MAGTEAEVEVVVVEDHPPVREGRVARMPGREQARGGRGISVREAQVLGMLSQGGTTDQIARELSLSPETVKTRVRNATRKLGAHGRLPGVILALVHGEIRLPAPAPASAAQPSPLSSRASRMTRL